MPDSIKRYLSHFIGSSQKHLQFLVDDLGFTCIAGMVEYKNGRKLIKPLDTITVIPDDLRQIWCVVRYEKDDFALELGYGDMDLRLEAYVYHDRIIRSALLDLLSIQGVGCDDLPLQWLRDDDVIDGAIKTYADLIHANKRYIFKNDEKTIRKIQIQRSKKIRNTIKQHHDTTMRSITLMSSKAMQNKDYRRVIELLRPYKRYLSKASLTMLEQAQNQILQKNG
jgi:hypothetical protein